MFNQKQDRQLKLGDKEKQRGVPTRKQLKDNQKCGCGDSRAPNLNYEPRNQIGYYKLLEQKLHFYTRYWANDMIGKMVQAGDVNLVVEDIEIIQLTQEERQKLKAINKQIFYNSIKKVQEQQMDDVPNAHQFTTNDQNANVNKVVRAMAQSRSSISNPEFKQRIEEGLQEYVQYLKYCEKIYSTTEYKFNECSKDHLGNMLAHMSGYKVNLHFVGETEVRASFHVLYFLNSQKKQSKFSFTYQPYFILDYSQVDWSKNEQLVNKRFQQSFVPKQDYTIEEVYKLFQKEPKAQYFPDFAKKFKLRIKSDGFFYQPGRTEHRTSCRLALGTLRLGIQMAFQVFYSPSIIVHHCPPVHEHIIPNEDPGVEFFFKDPPVNQQKPPKEKPVKEKVPERDIPKQERIPKTPPVKIEKQQQKIIIDPPVEIVKKPPVNLYEIEIVASATVEVIDSILEMEVPPAVKQKLIFSCFDFEEQKKFNRFVGDIGFLLDMAYNADNIFIECVSEFQAGIKYGDKIKGYIDFIIDGEDYCTEIELVVLGQEVSGFECHSGSVENLDSLPEEADKLVFVAKLAYGPFIKNLYEVINKLSKMDSQSLSPNDFFLYFLSDYELEVDGLGKFLLLSNKFSKLKIIENQNYTEEIRSSIEGQIGNIDYFYFDQYPYVPIKISVTNSMKGFFKIRIDVGFQFLELYVPTTITYTDSELQEIKNLFKNLEQQVKEQQQQQNKDQENEVVIDMPYIEQNGIKISMEDVGKDEYRILIKNKLKELFKEEFDNFFKQIFLSDTEGLFIQMAEFEGFQQIQYPNILQKYFTTDLMSFQVLAATFNFIMLNFNNDRLPPPNGQKMSDIVSQFEQLQSITADQASSKIGEFKTFWRNLDPLEFDNLVQTEAHPYPNIYGLEYDAMWLYYLEGEEGSSLKNLARAFVIEKINKDMVMDLSYGEKLIQFDLDFLNEKFLYNQNNYYSALFGNKTYNAKTIVRLWRYNYHPLKVIHVRLETMKFHTDHIIAESDYYDVVREFIKVIQEHTKHHEALMNNYKETAGSMKKVTYEKLYTLINEVFEEIKTNCNGGEKQEQSCQGMQFPYSLCLSKNSYSPTNQESKQILFYFEEKENGTIFSDDTVCNNEQQLKPAFKISEEGVYFNFQIFNARNSKMQKCKKTKESLSNGHKSYFNEYKFPIENCYSVELSFRRYFYNQIFNFEFGKFSSIY